MNLAAWLRGVGLERYAPVFRENDIDAAICAVNGRRPQGTRRGLGGHRQRLLDAIDALKATLGRDAVDMRASAAHSAHISQHVIAERRQPTVLFCDIAGSNELASRSDPEDYRDLLGA